MHFKTSSLRRKGKRRSENLRVKTAKMAAKYVSPELSNLLRAEGSVAEDAKSFCEATSYESKRRL